MILKPQSNMLLISAAVLFLFSAAEAYAMRIIDISERVKLCLGTPDPKFDKLQSFLKAADSVTYSMSGLKASDKSALCSVIITENDMNAGFEISTSGDVLRIFLPDDLSVWGVDYKIQSAVISAMLLGRFGIKPDTNYGKVPVWMIAGILSKIEMRRNPAMLSGVPVYPGIRGLVSGDVQPDLWCIMNNPLEYGDGPSFTLYSEPCAIIIDSIARIPKHRGMFMAILKSAVAGEKPDTAFKTAIDDYIIKGGFDFSTLPVNSISPEKRVEIWFGTAIRNSSINIFFPGSSGFVEKRLDELKTLNYTVATETDKDKPDKSEPDRRTIERPNNRTDKQPDRQTTGQAAGRTAEIRSCEIWELGKRWDEIENPERIANIYRKYFGDLSNQSSSMIQDDVRKIAELFGNLKDNDREAFERDFKDAEANLRGKIVKLRQIEDYIRESETKFVPFGKKYSAELKYIDESGTFTGRVCPYLNSILDKEEKDF